MAHEFSVTIETEKVAEVTAVGIQGVPGTVGNLESLPNVDGTGIVDGALLVFDSSSETWVATKTLEKQNITGGQY
jgi:hypothetical protein